MFTALLMVWTGLLGALLVVQFTDDKITCVVTNPAEVCGGDFTISVLLLWLGGVILFCALRWLSQ